MHLQVFTDILVLFYIYWTPIYLGFVEAHNMSLYHQTMSVYFVQVLCGTVNRTA